MRTALSFAVGLTVASAMLLGACGCSRREAAVPAPAAPVVATAKTRVAPKPAPPSAPPPLKPVIFARVATKQPVVALTFDCCQNRHPAGFDKRLVEELIETHTPATFMLGGRWMETHLDALKLLASTPFFELGNHSYIHPHMTKLSLARMREELVRTQQILHKHTGRWATVFRPPYGEWDKRLVAEAARDGMRTIMWSVETGDPDPHISAADILAAVHKVKPGGVIIMHANGRGWHSAEALPSVIAWLKKKGLRPVTVAELVKLGTPVNLEAPK